MADEELWPALQRLVKRIREDATETFAGDPNLKRAWLKGALDSCGFFLANIAQTAEDAQKTLEEERQAREVARSVAEDGVGSGDFAGL